MSQHRYTHIYASVLTQIDTNYLYVFIRKNYSKKRVYVLVTEALKQQERAVDLISIIKDPCFKSKKKKHHPSLIMLAGSAINDWCSAGKVFQRDTSE